MTDLLLMGAGGPAGAGYDTDADALFTRMAAASDAATDPLKALINTYILALKTGALSGSNIWNKIDVMAEAMLGAPSSLLNWKTGTFGNGALAHTSGSTDATFTTKVGFSGNGNTSGVGTWYIRLAYTPSTQAVNYLLSAATIANHALIDQDSSLCRDLGQFAAGTGGRINLNGRSGANARVQLNDAGLLTTAGTTISTRAGVTAARRVDASNVSVYHNTTFIDTIGADSSTSLPTQDITILGDVSQTDRMSGGGSAGWLFAGLLSTNEYTDWYNAHTAFRTGVGAL